MAVTSRPSARSAAAAESRRSTLRPLIFPAYPSRASAPLMARPMPADAPVTMAALSATVPRRLLVAGVADDGGVDDALDVDVVMPPLVVAVALLRQVVAHGLLRP